MPEVDKFKTKPSSAEWQDALGYALDQVKRPALSKESTAVLWAQWALETARGNGMWNYNFGNITPYDPSKQNYVVLKTYIGTIMKFRAYDNYRDGAADWIKWFSRREDVWKVLLAASPKDFAYILRKYNYYLEDADNYAKQMDGLWHEYMGVPASVPSPSIPNSPYKPSNSGSGTGLLLAGGVLGGLVWFLKGK